jgi:hypothetical protein
LPVDQLHLLEGDNTVIELSSGMGFCFPPEYSPEGLQPLFDELTSMIQVLIIKEDLVPKHKIQLVRICAEAERVLRAIVAAAEYLSVESCDRDLEHMRTWMLDEMLLFLDLFRVDSRVLATRKTAMILAIVCRAYFCVALHHLRLKGDREAPDLTAHREMEYIFFRDCHALAQFHPSQARFQLQSQLEAKEYMSASFCCFVRQLSWYFRASNRILFAEMQSFFSSDHDHVMKPYGDVLWVLFFDVVEILQFGDTGVVAPVSDDHGAKAWSMFLYLIKAGKDGKLKYSRLVQSEPNNRHGVLANRARSLAAILPPADGSTVKDLWELIFNPKKWEDQLTKEQDWIADLVGQTADQIIRLATHPAAADVASDGDVSFGIYMQMLAIMIAKTEPNKVKFRVNALLSHALAPLSNLQAASSDSQHQVQLGILTTVSTVRIVLAIFPTEAVSLWENNITKRLLEYSTVSDGNLATALMKTSDFAALSTLMEGVIACIPLVFRQGLAQKLNAAAIGEAIGGLFFHLVDVITSTEKEWILKKWIGPGITPTRENQDLIEQRRNCLKSYLEQLDSLISSLPDSASRLTAPFLLDYFSHKVVRKILTEYSKHQICFHLNAIVIAGVLGTLSSWIQKLMEINAVRSPPNHQVKNLTQNAQQLSEEDLDNIYQTYEPLKHMVIVTTINFDSNNMPAIGDALATFVCFFYRQKPVPTRPISLDTVLSRFSIWDNPDAKWYDASNGRTWETRTLQIAFMTRLLELRAFWSPTLVVPTFLPLAIWFHSMLETKLTTQLHLLKAINLHDDRAKPFLQDISFAAVKAERHRMGVELSDRRLEFKKHLQQSKRNKNAQSRIDAFGLTEEKAAADLAFRLTVLKPFLKACRSQISQFDRQTLSQMKPDFLFKDIAPFFRTLTTGPDVHAFAAHHRQFLMNVFGYAASLCPSLMFDQVKFSACPLFGVFDIFVEHNYKSELKVPLKYLLHGLAQLRAVQGYTSYETKFLTLLHALFCTVSIPSYQPPTSAGRDEPLGSILSGLTPPVVAEHGLYQERQRNRISEIVPAPVDPQPVVMKTDPSGGISRKNNKIEVGLNKPINELRDFVLGVVLPCALDKPHQHRLAVLALRMFNVAFGDTVKTINFPRDLVCFSLCCKSLSSFTVRVPSHLERLPLIIYALAVHRD